MQCGKSLEAMFQNSESQNKASLDQSIDLGFGEFSSRLKQRRDEHVNVFHMLLDD